MKSYSLTTLKKEQWLDLSRHKGSKAKTWVTIKAIARHEGVPLLCHNAESTNSHTGHKSDAFGLLDLIIKEPGQIRGIQACSQDWQPHIRKLQDNLITCERWLAGGFTTLELWGWRKVKRRGRMTWRCRVQLITLPVLRGDQEGVICEVFED